MTILGISQTKAALARVAAEMAVATPIAERASAGVVARAVAARAPRDTGRLISSIRVDPDDSGANAVVDVDYARFNEYGTRYMPAQHFMADAADASTSGIVATMLAVYRAAIH
jgi:HK97 gp10 family phage protein